MVNLLICTFGGDLNLDISSPLSERTLTIGDDDTTDPVSLLIEGNIITNDGILHR